MHEGSQDSLARLRRFERAAQPCASVEAQARKAQDAMRTIALQKRDRVVLLTMTNKRFRYHLVMEGDGKGRVLLAKGNQDVIAKELAETLERLLDTGWVEPAPATKAEV